MTRRRARLLPKYVKWRDGRPRWELGGMGGKALTEAGFRSIDLKDETGAWLSFEQARLAGDALNEAVAAWRAGATAPDRATLEHLAAAVPAAPAAVLGEAHAVKGAPSTGRFMQAPARPADATLGRYITAHLDSLRGRSPATRHTYASKAKPLIAWLGDVRPAAITPQVAQKFHATLMDAAFWKAEEAAAGNAPPRFPHDAVRALTHRQKEELRIRRLEALDDLGDAREAAGFTMAYDTCIYARLAWNWARKHEGLAAPNPFEGMDLTSPMGRVRYLEPGEILHLIETADRANLHWMGDLVIVALHSLQRRADQMTLSWAGLRRGYFDLVQAKTGKVVKPAVTETLRRRAGAMAARQSQLLRFDDPGAMIGPLLRDGHGRPFTDPRQLTDAYATLRDMAAETMPSLADSKLHDLRDTGVTRFYLATKDMVRVCKQSGHSIASLELIIKHYLADHPEIAASAAASHDEWMQANGVKW